MPIPNRPASQTKHTEQNIDNSSFDEDSGVRVFLPLGFDGTNLQRTMADNFAVKITVSGAVTYMGVAAPGTAQATALWQCKKIDTTSGTVITFADGDANFDNVATDLASLSYS